MAQPRFKPERKRGYRRFAEYMTWNPSMAIFPRFRAANMLNLLCLQAEISDLEQKLSDTTDLDDKSQDPHRRIYSSDWNTLKEIGKDSEQWKLVLDLRMKLAEYNQALVHQITLHDQIGPDEKYMGNLRSWMRDHVAGLGSILEGPGCLNWLPVEKGGRPVSDHLALASKSVQGDSITRWASTSVLRPSIAWTLKLFPSWLVQSSQFLPDEDDGEHAYIMHGTADSIKSMGDKITSFLAAVLILVPVIILHFLHNANSRLVVIVSFTLGFTLVLVLATDAKRSEVFAASAAFAAVQVIYVGSALNG